MNVARNQGGREETRRNLAATRRFQGSFRRLVRGEMTLRLSTTQRNKKKTDNKLRAGRLRQSQKQKALSHRIETAPAPGMASQQPARRQPCAPKPSMPRNCDGRIFRTRWLEPATAGHGEQGASETMKDRRNRTFINPRQNLNPRRPTTSIRWLHNLRRVGFIPALWPSAPCETRSTHLAQYLQKEHPAPPSADAKRCPHWPLAPRNDAEPPPACAV